MKITIKDFQKKIPINPIRIRKTILKILSSERPLRSYEITVCFVNEKKIKELNKRYLNKDSSTDVLAFDISQKTKPNCLLADIVICADQALKNARIFKTGLSRELNLYAAHGILHILGYDHRNKNEIMLMRQKEREYANT